MHTPTAAAAVYFLMQENMEGNTISQRLNTKQSNSSTLFKCTGFIFDYNTQFLSIDVGGPRRERPLS